jgi:hypothetical protein
MVAALSCAAFFTTGAAHGDKGLRSQAASARRKQSTNTAPRLLPASWATHGLPPETQIERDARFARRAALMQLGNVMSVGGHQFAAMDVTDVHSDGKEFTVKGIGMWPLGSWSGPYKGELKILGSDGRHKVIDPRTPGFVPPVSSATTHS